VITRSAEPYTGRTYPSRQCQKVTLYEEATDMKSPRSEKLTRIQCKIFSSTGCPVSAYNMAKGPKRHTNIHAVAPA